MAMTDILRGAQGGAAMTNLGNAFGITVEEAGAVVDAVVPRLSEHLERNTLSRGGLADLVQALGHGHHEVYLDDPRTFTDPATREDGNGILDHIVGSKDASRGLANKAERESGVSADVIRNMLPVIAGMMMGGLSKQVKQSFGDIANRAPSGGQGGGGFLPRKPLPRSAPQDQNTGSWGDQQQQQPQRSDGGVRMNERGGLEMPDGMGQHPDQGGGRGQRGDMGGGIPLPMPGNRVPEVPGNADNPFGDLAEIIRKGFGLPGGSGGPVVIQLPGGMQLPFPMPGGGGQGGGGMQMPRGGGQMPGGQGGGFPWPGGGDQGGGIPMPQGNPRSGGGGGFPWPGGGGQGQGIPMPGGNGRGIELPGGQVGGSMLWNIIRTILGSALGFQSRGIMGWLLRAGLLKFAWPILRSILMGGRR